MNRFLIVLVFVTLIISRSFASNITVVTENLPPLQIAHKNQLVGGFATEVVELLLEQVGENARIIVTNWARAYHMARKHPNVLIFSMTRTKEREELFKWVGAVNSFDTYLWKLEDRDDIYLESLEDAKNYRTVVSRNNLQHFMLRSQGFEEEQHLMLASEHNQAVELFLRRRADLFIDGKIFLEYRLKTLGIDFNIVKPVMKLAPSTNYIAFSLSTPDYIVDEYRHALAQIQQDPAYALLVKKWRSKMFSE